MAVDNYKHCCEYIKMDPLDCLSDTEDQHAKDLLVMEEEARIRRRNLMKRINYEHCVQQKERQELIKKIDNDIRDIERKKDEEVLCSELELKVIEAHVEVVNGVTANRTDHLRKCHDNQVIRLGMYRARLEGKIQDIKSLIPEVVADLRVLENPEETENQKFLKEMEKKLKQLRNQSRDMHRAYLADQDKLKADLDHLVKSQDLQYYSDQLRNDQAQARNIAAKEEESLHQVNFVIAHYNKKLGQVESEEQQNVEAKLKEAEIAALEKELEGEEKVMQGLKQETKNLRDHFTERYEHKMEAQQQRLKDGKDRLKQKRDDLQLKFDQIAEARKNLPKDFADAVARLKRKLKEDLKLKDQRMKEIEIEHRENLASLKGNQGDRFSRLRDKLKQLEDKEKVNKKKFEKDREKLEQKIDKVSALIPEVLDAIDNADKDFVNVLSKSQGSLGKAEILNQMATQTNKNSFNQLCGEMDNLNSRLEQAKADTAAEIARKENEVEKLLQEHRQVYTDINTIDKQVRLRTKDLQNEAEHARYKLRCLRAMIRDQNTTYATLDGSTFQEEQDMMNIVRRAQQAHNEERERIESLIEEEEAARALSIEQLKEAVNLAIIRKHDLEALHSENRQVLTERLNEKRRALDVKTDLQRQVDELGAKIKELEEKMHVQMGKHESSTDKLRKVHENHMDGLQRKKAMQMQRVDQQKLVNNKVSQMQDMLDSVNRGLEAINIDAIAADTEETEDLQEKLSILNNQNDALVGRLREMSKLKEDMGFTLNQIAPAEDDVSEHQQDQGRKEMRLLHNMHTGLLTEINQLRGELKNLKKGKRN